MTTCSGARLIAQTLKDLDVSVIFGLVGIPVVEIAEEAIALGIRFLGFRNEQAASYAATAYGYLTGRPGVCLVVGGPGVLHAVAGVGNAEANAFPLLLLAGSCETHLVGRGAFQELDAISLLKPHVRLATRILNLQDIPDQFAQAYHATLHGRPGTAFVDLPANIIQARASTAARPKSDARRSLPAPTEATPEALPKADPKRVHEAARMLRQAQAPLIIVGKGAAYARAEQPIRDFVDATHVFFLPTPMGKGVVPDSHPLNTASARSAALKNADVVLVLGARLNWILHFGEPPKWSPHVRFIQVDIDPSALELHPQDRVLGLIGDVGAVCRQIGEGLQGWQYGPSQRPYWKAIRASAIKNEAVAANKAQQTSLPLSYHHAFDIIKRTLEKLSPAADGNIVFVSEGANTMDISRSIFPVEHPRRRLDAGTFATMGVGLGYAIAAHAAYNPPLSATDVDVETSRENTTPISTTVSASTTIQSFRPSIEPRPAMARKKIVCFEGDSAFGFSAMEVETMARYGMDILIFVLNNGGIYHGDADDAETWSALQQQTTHPHASQNKSAFSTNASTANPIPPNVSSKSSVPPSTDREQSLKSTTLSFQTPYEQLATMAGGHGFCVRTAEELEHATRAGFEASKVCVVNIIIASGKGSELAFGWQASSSRPLSKSVAESASAEAVESPDRHGASKL